MNIPPPANIGSQGLRQRVDERREVPAQPERVKQPSEFLGLTPRSRNRLSPYLIDPNRFTQLTEHSKVAAYGVGIAATVNNGLRLSEHTTALNTAAIGMSAMSFALSLLKSVNGSLHRRAETQDRIYETEISPQSQQVVQALGRAIDALPEGRQKTVKSALATNWEALRDSFFMAVSDDPSRATQGTRELANNTQLNKALGYPNGIAPDTRARAFELLQFLGNVEQGATSDTLVLTEQEYVKAGEAFNAAAKDALPTRSKRFWMEQFGKQMPAVPDHEDDAVYLASEVLGKIGVPYNRYREALENALELEQNT